MTERINITLFEPVQAHKVLTQQIWPLIKASLMAGHRMVVEVRKETRSLEQNRRLWAMLAAIERSPGNPGRERILESVRQALTKLPSAPTSAGSQSGSA